MIKALDGLLEVKEGEAVSGLQGIKANPAKPSATAMQGLADKLAAIEATGTLAVNLSWVNVGAERDDSGVTAALGNALRTLLAFYSLDAKHGGGMHRVESRVIDGIEVTALDAERVPPRWSSRQFCDPAGESPVVLIARSNT